MATYFVLGSIVLFFLLLHFAASHLEKKGLVNYRYRKPSAASVGTALLELNAISRPNTYNVIEAMEVLPGLPDEDVEADGGGRKLLKVQLSMERLR